MVHSFCQPVFLGWVLAHVLPLRGIPSWKPTDFGPTERTAHLRPGISVFAVYHTLETVTVSRKMVSSFPSPPFIHFSIFPTPLMMKHSPAGGCKWNRPSVVAA